MTRFSLVFAGAGLLAAASCPVHLPPIHFPPPAPSPTVAPTPTELPQEPLITPTPTPEPSPTPCPPGTHLAGGPRNSEPSAHCAPDATPIPPPTATPAGFPLPEVAFFKTGGTNQVCRRGSTCCHNPESGPRFQNGHVCEVGGTLYLAPAVPPDSDPHLAGPCDPDHQANWNSFCLRRDWDNNSGPVRRVTGAASWTVNSDNPFHTDVIFEPGTCFEICAAPPDPFFTSDGIRLKVQSGAERCVTHCY